MKKLRKNLLYLADFNFKKIEKNTVISNNVYKNNKDKLFIKLKKENFSCFFVLLILLSSQLPMSVGENLTSGKFLNFNLCV